MTVDASTTIATGATLTTNAGATINGTFQINQSGFAQTGTWTYGSTTGTLVFNNSSGSYGVNNDVYWPSSNGPYNVTVQGAGGITMNVSRTVPTTGTTGTFLVSSGSVAGSALTLNGTAQINGGNFSTAPIYGSSSLLKYNVNTSYGRNNEWSQSSGTIGTTAGFPNDVQLSNNTTLDYPNASNGNTTTNRGLNRDLIIDAGSSLYMDYGSGTTSGTLTVGRNISIAGNLSLGESFNGFFGDIFVGGNWTHTTGTFAPNSRAVNFNGATGDQTITNASGETFDYVIVNKATSGNVVLANNVTVNQTLTLTKGFNRWGY